MSLEMQKHWNSVLLWIIMNMQILIFISLALLLLNIFLGVLLISSRRTIRQSRAYQYHWKTISNNIPDLLMILNKDLIIDYINPASAQFLTQAPLSYLAQPLDLLIQTEKLTGFSNDCLQSVLSSGKIEFCETQTSLTKEQVCLELRFIPETDDSSTVIRMLIIGRNISKQKQIENELKAAALKAKESDLLKSAFLANMSHEIRTPLNAIVGFASIILEEELSEEEKERYKQYINVNSNHLISLINDIIDISKIESKQIAIMESEINLNLHMNEIKEIIENEKINRDKQHLLIFAENDLPDSQANIMVDAYRLRQILLNILTNAIKFTPKGFIQFGYRMQDKNTILFYVRDSGIGIPQKDQKHVFQYFRQLENSLTRKYGGTGLGLAISKNLVRLMGGTIWLESKEKKGTTFFFTLPYKNL